MKKEIAVLISTIAVASASFAGLVTVTDNMDTLAGWNNTGGWTTSGGIAETGANSQFLTMQQGVPAPQNVGDYVTASIIQRATFGAVGHTNTTIPNSYNMRIAISGDATGGSGMVKSMWSRRNPNGNGDIYGSALTAPGDGTWLYTGWNNISELGFGATTNSTSSWFTAELTITKAASGYDLLVNYKDDTGAVVWSQNASGQAIPTLAASSTWYLNAGTEYQFSLADLTKMEIDQASLTSSIPEPATIGLVAAFGGAVLFIRRRFMM